MALLKDLTVFGASRFVLDIIANNIYSNGYHHNDHNNDDAVLLAGGGWETITNLLGAGYWADQPVTSLGSTTTEPTFGKVTVNGSIYGRTIYANANASGTANGLSLYSTSTPDAYGIAMRTTNTTTFAKIGKVQGDWATFFTMNNVDNRGWIFRSGTTSYASISTRGEAYFTAIGKDGYIPYPHRGKYITATSTVTGAICIELPVSWTNTMLKFEVDIYNYSNGNSVTYIVGGYNHSGSSAWINTTAYALRYNGIDRGNLKVRFGHNGTHCCVYIGETTTTWNYPQVVVRNFHAGFTSGNYSYNTWASGWVISFVTTLGTITSGAAGTIENTAVNYYANLLYPQTTTSTGAVSAWATVPNGCIKVWSEKFTDSSLKYTPSGGSQTNLTDSGDIVMWLKPTSNANIATLNISIDGGYYSNGFHHLAQDSNNYVLLAGGEVKSLADFAMCDDYVKKIGDTMTGTIYRAYSANDQTPFIWINGGDYDNYIWKISSGTTTNQYYGYALKYIGSGSDDANYLRLYADNKNSTDVIAIGINQSGQVGISTDANVNYRLYVSGKSMFTNTLNIDSNSIGTAGAHINFNRANFNYINIPTNGTLAVCINGVGGANTFLAIDSAAVYPGYHNNSVTLGTTLYKWSKVYIGANASYGGTTQPIYWNDGVPTATLYSLSASIAAGAANRMAYYSDINAITYASSIYATTTALAINSTSITSGYNFQVLGSSLLRLIAPQTTNTYDIGTTSLRWKSMYNVEEYIGTASGSQCHIDFDNTNKCLRFIFD